MVGWVWVVLLLVLFSEGLRRGARCAWSLGFGRRVGGKVEGEPVSLVCGEGFCCVCKVACNVVFLCFRTIYPWDLRMKSSSSGPCTGVACHIVCDDTGTGK